MLGTVILLYILRIAMLLLFSATLGGGSTGMIREPRHQPLLLVSTVLPGSGSSPPATGRGTNTRCLWRPRPPMVANHWHYPFSLSAPNRYQSVANNNNYRCNTVWPTPCFVWPLRSTHLRKKRGCLLYTSPSPRDQRGSRMPSSA